MEIWYNNIIEQINQNRPFRTVLAVFLCSVLAFTATSSFTLQAQSSQSSSGFSSSFSGVTNRLMRRIARMNPLADDVRVMLSVEDRAALLNHELTLVFAPQEGSPVPAGVRLRMQDHPEWVVFNPEISAFEIDESSVRMFFEEHLATLLPVAANAVAQHPETAWVERFEVVGNPREGYRVDSIAAARALIAALEARAPEAVIPATHQSPALFVRTASGTIQLERLSRGISNFKGSPWGRKANVVKALESHLRGVIIQPGEAFSFTKALADGSGWSDAYVIANGGELVLEPGGGICQAATTAFRAAVLAGLPVEERANHSLYVTYYRAHGVGIDATYYPGKQDLAFRNDTQSPIVMVAYAEGDNAIVELYGKPDGRSVAVHGPYFSEKKDVLAESRALDLKINQIGWLYDVTYPDGAVKQDALISTYKAIPRKLRDEYATHPGIEELMGLTGTGGIAQ